MKKSIILLGMLSAGFTYAQNYRVGINTEDPKATLHIKETIVTKDDGSENEEYPQGVLFPKFSTTARAKFTNVTEGTLIYNTDKKCVEVFLEANTWDCITNVENGGGGNNIQQRIAVSASGFTGNYHENVSMAGNTVKFALKNNGVTALSNVDFSNAVTAFIGSTPVAVTGTANNNVTLYGGATKELVYQLSGNATAGTLTAKFDQLGLTAEQSVQVGLGNANLQDVSHIVYTSADQEIENINNTKKITIQIPYTGGSGRHDGASVTATTAVGHNGDVNTLTLDIPAGQYATNGNLTATITVEGDGVYNLRRMTADISYDIATFNININGNTTTVKLIGQSGIMSGDFYYIPITYNGVTMLNHNIGAETAKINSRYFSKSVVANYDKSREIQGYGYYYSSTDVFNICPSGYRLPTATEYDSIKTILPNSGTMSTTGYRTTNTGRTDKDVAIWVSDRVNYILFTNNEGTGRTSSITSKDTNAPVRCVKQ